jgi:lysine decarboxylase/arginine decarboxylase
VVQGLGPDKLVEEGIGEAKDQSSRASVRRQDSRMAPTTGIGFGQMATGFHMLTRSSPLSSRLVFDLNGKFAKTGIPASIVTKFRIGVIVEKSCLASFIMPTIGITKGRWNTC